MGREAKRRRAEWMALDPGERARLAVRAELWPQLLAAAEYGAALAYNLVNWHIECSPECAGELHVGYIESGNADPAGEHFPPAEAVAAYLANNFGAEYVGHAPAPRPARMGNHVTRTTASVADGEARIEAVEIVEARMAHAVGIRVAFRTPLDLARLQAAVLRESSMDASGTPLN